MTANRIIQHIFQEPDIKQVEESALEQLVTSYPYFTTARLLLAKKQYTVQKNLLAPAVKKAQLYSTNMHYFYRFLNNNESAAVPEVPVVEIPAPVIEIPEPVIETPEPVAEIPEPVVEIPEPVIEASVPEPVAEVEPVVTAPPVEEKPIPQPEPLAAYNAPLNPEEPKVSISVMPPEEPIRIFPLELQSKPEEELTYQPLYTDDYFAYKRIKDPETAEVISEKGANEMKSFTSWLKDIKNTFSEKAATKQQYHQQLKGSYEDFDPEVSETVEKMAMASITLTDDVVSETLAEIWARQQQYQRAILIYQKLSLLNPNKSAYFAQKIKELQLLTDNN
jgi:hypothetical protein